MIIYSKQISKMNNIFSSTNETESVKWNLIVIMQYQTLLNSKKLTIWYSKFLFATMLRKIQIINIISELINSMHYLF